MLVTLFGIVTLVRLVQEPNAPLPMLVTGSPLIVAGMAIAPPVPVYPLMVIVPFTGVQTNGGSHKYAGSPAKVAAHPVFPEDNRRPYC